MEPASKSLTSQSLIQNGGKCPIASGIRFHLAPGDAGTGTGTGLENLNVDHGYLLSAEACFFKVCWVCEIRASGRSGVIMRSRIVIEN